MDNCIIFVAVICPIFTQINKSIAIHPIGWRHVSTTSRKRMTWKYFLETREMCNVLKRKSKLTSYFPNYAQVPILCFTVLWTFYPKAEPSNRRTALIGNNMGQFRMRQDLTVMICALKICQNVKFRLHKEAGKGPFLCSEVDFQSQSSCVQSKFDLLRINSEPSSSPRVNFKPNHSPYPLTLMLGPGPALSTLGNSSYRFRKQKVISSKSHGKWVTN